MGYQNFISEAEALAVAGVSVKTLQRFTDAGYLHVEVEPDGLRLYSRDEIHEIFGVHQGRARSSEDLEHEDLCSVAHTTELPPTPEQVEVAAAASADAIQPSNGDMLSICSEAHSEPIPGTTDTEGDTGAAAIPEISRLRTLVDLQEKILDMKETEIADLRAQRDWLRRRVERLEEKGDRDQVLLLSETQTIRRLVSMQENRPSGIRQLFAWLGLTSTKQVHQIAAPTSYAKEESAIEVKEAANG